MADLICAGCGCVCDDGRLCPLGEAWLDLGERPPLARVDGVEVSLEEAVAAASGLLRGARAPLVYGLSETSIEAQRRAVALAEALGAVIDPGGSPYAYQAIGASTATFGEIRDRAELVVLWRADPAVTHPRLLERLGPDAVVVLDHDFEALWDLRSGAAQWHPDARHIAFIHGPLDDLSALALASFVRDLNRDRHAVTLALRPGNARGAEDVVAWQTGFAGAVSFARGVPRESPGAAELLERGDVDAALVLADVAVGDLPTVAVSPRAVAAKVAIAPAADGIEVAGTVHRMDGVPLPLRAPRPTDRPSVEDVLAAIEGHG